LFFNAGCLPKTVAPASRPSAFARHHLSVVAPPAIREDGGSRGFQAPECKPPNKLALATGSSSIPPSGPGAGCPILAFFLRKGGRPRPPRRFQPACQFDLRGLPKITLTQRTIKVSESSMMKQTTAESTTLTVPFSGARRRPLPSDTPKIAAYPTSPPVFTCYLTSNCLRINSLQNKTCKMTAHFQLKTCFFAKK
jgi:hypothetical protein